MVRQWPDGVATIPTNTDRAYLDAQAVDPLLNALFHNWRRNKEFRKYIQQIQEVMDEPHIDIESPGRYQIDLPHDNYHPRQGYLSWRKLLAAPAPEIDQLTIPDNKTQEFSVRQHSTALRRDGQDLQTLLHRLSNLRQGQYERNYIKDLTKSSTAFGLGGTNDLLLSGTPPQKYFQDALSRAKSYVDDVYRTICDCLRTSASGLLGTGNDELMLPRLSPSIILSHLAQFAPSSLNPQWKRALINFGLGLTALQRAERLLSCAENQVELLSELQNPGHLDWDPFDHPDWLLLEIENGILIRQEQAQISKEMIAPSSGSNSIMQLNMGLGKSSVIVPVVAAAVSASLIYFLFERDRTAMLELFTKSMNNN